MSDVVNGKGYTCLCVCVWWEVKDILEISVPHCCKPKLESKNIFKNICKGKKNPIHSHYLCLELMESGSVSDA